MRDPVSSEQLLLSGADAFALEAELLDLVSTGQSSFEVAIWETERCLVVPQAFTRNENFERAASDLKAHGWPVFTRCTGGDVTPQGRGTLNVTLAYRLPPDTAPSIDDHYDTLCRPIAAHLQSWGHVPEFSAIPHSFCDGAHNLSVGGRKMVGTAQRWRRIKGKDSGQMVFAHALILVDADLSGGIAATNRLYEGCNLSHRVHETVHVNLASLFPQNHTATFGVVSYAEHLRNAYTEALRIYTT